MIANLTRFSRRVYRRVASLSWEAVVVMTGAHFAVSWALLFWIGYEEIASPRVFWYFYVTTATTVGYGDYSPVTELGRLITVLWVMPGGIALFTTIIAKVVQHISNGWRRRMRGVSNYENLENHIVILGWHGLRTQRMVEHIRGDRSDKERDIVLCSSQFIENPMPDDVRFVRGSALNTPDVLQRAAVANAEYIIALGHDDNETLAAALGAAAANNDAHMVAYFEQQSFSDLLKSHCPHAESNVSLSIEMMVRSAQDPGSSRVHRQLLSTLEGPTQFSLQVPHGVKVFSYGALFTELKKQHDATLFGVAKTALGEDLILNAHATQEVTPGAIVYFMSAQRIDAKEIDWPAISSSPGV